MLDRQYYDSRHVIPLAWFLFFTADDIVGRETHSGAYHWLETWLCAEKRLAVNRFADQLEIVVRQYGHLVDENVFRKFADTVCGMDGRLLVVDPHEIAGDYDHSENVRQMSQVFSALQSFSDQDREFIVAARPYWHWIDNPSYDAELQLLGCTYQE
ncbi:hypothetical protein [Aeoliella sp.]|uniref:hypothetical protein n=1 Tax=Aeoliella sp. TaxID=2795800 RepID=UPI003CCBFDE0